MSVENDGKAYCLCKAKCLKTQQQQQQQRGYYPLPRTPQCRTSPQVGPEVISSAEGAVGEAQHRGADELAHSARKKKQPSSRE